MVKNNKIMDKCLILTTGRTGSDYLNACLDGVDGVMTFCGKFNYHEFFNGPTDKIEKEKLIDLFLKKYHFLFSYNELESIDTNINTKILRENFLKITTNLSLNRKEFLLNIYKAYHLTLNRNIEMVKILIHHTHNPQPSNVFLEDFPDAKMLITIRDPRANLKSGMINHFDYNPKNKNMDHVLFYMRRIREDLKFAMNKKNKKLFVKLEEANDYETKMKIVRFLDVNFDKRIMISTLASKIWNGDKLTKNRRKDGGYLPSAKNNQWNQFFTNSDKLLLNLLFLEYKKFNYDIGNLKLKHRLKIFFLAFFPMSFEKSVFKSNNNEFKLKIINYKIFIKRIIYVLIVLFKCEIFIPPLRRDKKN